MSKSLNRAQIIGNVGQDPEMRTIPSGNTVCKLKIATTDSYKDKSGNLVESTEWHTVTLWDRLAEVANQYLKKGSKVFIEGKIKTSTYEKDGITKYFTEISASQMILLGNAPAGSGQGRDYSEQNSSPANNSNSNYPSPNNSVNSNNDYGTPKFSNKDEHVLPDFIDDDVPF